MDRAHFIISVYCLVCEHYARVCPAATPRHGGFQPTLTDQEVITIEICGEYFKCGTDKDLFAHFHTHYADWFPHLTDRTVFARRRVALSPRCCRASSASRAFGLGAREKYVARSLTRTNANRNAARVGGIV